MTGADADYPQAKIEEPVEKAVQLRPVGERSAQLGVPGVTAKRQPLEYALEALAEFAFEDDPTRQACHEAIILGAWRLRIPRHGVHPGERGCRPPGPG